RNLVWFFDQWLERADLPIVHLVELTASPKKDGTWEARLVVRQEGEPYRLALPLQFELADGGRVLRPAEGRRTREPRRVGLPASPRRVTVDPDGELLLGGSEREWAFSAQAGK